MNTLFAYLQADLEKVNALMEDSLKSDIPVLVNCNRHILDHKGKQVRPIIALLMARAVSGECNEDTIRFAAAAELIHNATLLHDDVADNSSSRRGVATIGSIIGPRPSVLLGDFWLVNGIARILDGEKSSARVMRLFGKTLACLAEGEMLQLEMASTGETTEKEYFRIIYDKTATLFETSALAGAISAGAMAEQELASAEYARCIGYAFQIQDDILDYIGNEAVGKPLGQDLREKKITLPLLGAMKSNAALVPEIRQRIVNISPENVVFVRRFVLENGGIEYARAAAGAYLQKAMDTLKIFPDGTAKDCLIRLAELLRERNK